MFADTILQRSAMIYIAFAHFWQHAGDRLDAS
jgi:hypothetical protein